MCGPFRLLSTPRAIAAALVAFAAPGAAQPAAPAEETIDPSAPLPPLPDLGVEWPTADAPGGDPGGPADPTDAVLRYRLEERGLAAIDLADDFRALSVLRSERAPANAGQIERRAAADVALIERLLRSRGHYAGVVSSTVRPPTAAGGEAIVTIAVEPGPRYDFERVTVTTPAGAPAALIESTLDLPTGVAVDAARVRGGVANVALALPRAGYAFPVVGEPDVVIDHDRRLGTLDLAVDPGPLTRFGAVLARGEPDLGAGHLDIISRFDAGGLYNEDLVTDFRRALIATGLFASVELTPVRRDTPAGALADLALVLAPAPPRTVAGEVGYDTEDGFRIEASWRHRNLLPPEGAFTARAVAGLRQTSIGGELVKSNWRRRDQSLTGSLEVARLTTDAFRSTGLVAAARLERRNTLIWQKPWTYSIGMELIAARERDRGGFVGRSQDYFLAALPGTLAYDASDDLLDPRRGFRLAGRLSPEASLQGDFAYARLRLDGSVYLPLGERVVAAGRLALGAIAGTSRVSIPPSRRWYVGGGGSVRGYGYQDIGPKDADGDPLGGRSFTEASVEARIRVTSTIGVVPFLDMGALYTTSYPGIDGMQYGAGIGARYYSSFGPIRVDVATPLNPRAGDPSVAVYVSIGQAF